MTAVSRIEPQTTEVVATTPMDMLQQAVASGASVELMERLLTMQERWEANAARKAFDAAVADARGQIGPIFKRQTATGGAKFAFESLDDIARQIDPVLAAHGLSYRFRSTGDANGITVTCILSHRDGHREENSQWGPADNGPGRNAIQSIGSSLTYLQRYTLKAALGLSASKDRDGAAAPGDGKTHEDWIACISECQSLDELHAYFKGIWPELSKQPKAAMAAVVAAKDARKTELSGADQ